MINLKLNMFKIFNKIKKHVLNVTLILIIFISLSATTHTDTGTIKELRAVASERDSLQSIISNGLSDLKVRENNIIRKTLNISQNHNTPTTIMTINGINDYIKNQKLIYKALEFEVEMKWDSISKVPSISPISSSELKYISDGYGYRLHPIKDKLIFHEGVDLAAPMNSDVFSTSSGVVAFIIHSDSGYGNRIVIDHENGYKTVYAHLNDISVILGQYVSIGEIIGHVGNTGLSTGPHLHYEVLVNNKHVNPSDYYNFGSEIYYDCLAIK